MNRPLRACVVATLMLLSAGAVPSTAQTATPAATAANADPQAVDKRLADLEARLKRAEAKLGNDPRALTPQNALDRRIESLERRTDKLEREVTSLDSRVKALERKK